jgi:hypothetical protein
MSSEDPDLLAAEAALASGNHAEARRRVRAVLTGSASDSVKERAREIYHQLASDRAVMVLLAACLVFLAVIVLTYTGKG